jgi:hypothetical protein
MPRCFLRLAAIAAMAVALAGCGRTESYRYKLTLAVNTPDGIKRGSSVVSATLWQVSIPASGIMTKLRGEALYLDLGPGARPLIALLTSYLHPKHGATQFEYQKAIRWSRDAGPGNNLLSDLYGSPPKWDPRPGSSYTDWYMNNVRRIAHMRGSHPITPNDLPDLVTFDDINEPKTVILVDPNDLQATLGPNITWNEITLEMTDEPITSGLVTKLPWLRASFERNLMLDGSSASFQTFDGAKKGPANILSWYEFDQSGDLKRIGDMAATWSGLLRAILSLYR